MREVAAIKQQKTFFSLGGALILAGFVMVFSLIRPEAASSLVRGALRLSVESVIPSLAVFAVGAKILVKSGACAGAARTPLAHLAAPLGVSAAGFSAFLIGLVSGFPMGAAALSDLVLRGEMTREEAESLLPFCNNAGPAFVIGTVGAAFFGSAQFGVILFAAQTAAAVLGVMLTAPARRKFISASCGAEKREVPAGRKGASAAGVIASSIAEGAAAMLSVCGFVVFFAVVSGAVSHVMQALNLNIGVLGTALLTGVLEVSGGFAALSGTALPPFALLAVSGAMLGFGGISVWMQAADRAGAASLSMSRYFSGKLLCAGLCAVFCVLFGILFQSRRGGFFAAGVIFLWILAGILFRFVKNHLFFKKGVEK